MPELYVKKATRLSRDILMFLAAIWPNLWLSSPMLRFIPPVVVLEPPIKNEAVYATGACVYAQVCWLFCVFYMSLFGLVVSCKACQIRDLPYPVGRLTKTSTFFFRKYSIASRWKPFKSTILKVRKPVGRPCKHPRRNWSRFKVHCLDREVCCD